MKDNFKIRKNSNVGASIQALGGFVLASGGVVGMANVMESISHKVYDAVVANPEIDYSQVLETAGLYAHTIEASLSAIALVAGGILCGVASSYKEYSASEIYSSDVDSGLEKVAVSHASGRVGGGIEKESDDTYFGGGGGGGGGGPHR